LGQINDKTKADKFYLDIRREQFEEQTEILFNFFNTSQHNQQEEDIHNYTIKSSPKFGEVSWYDQSSVNSTKKDFYLKSRRLSQTSDCSSDKLYFLNSLREQGFSISEKSNDVSREDMVKTILKCY